MSPDPPRACPTVIAGAAVALLLTGCATTVVHATDVVPTPDAAGVLAVAERYCVESGGAVESRQPMFGTNNDRATWVEIGEPVSTCAFHREEEGDAPDTWIYVDPVTLYSQRPTLAALAYLSRPSLPEVSGGANPASAMCTELGGASAFGPSASGGGYVLEGTDSIEVFLPCTFADGSFIEEWGIAYYGAGTVRGQDLAPLFNFDIDAVPPVFG